VAKKVYPTELAIGAVTSSGHVLWSTQTPFRRQDSRQREAALTEALDKAGLNLLNYLLLALKLT